MSDDDLERVVAHTREWRASGPVRPIAPQASIEDLLAIFGGPPSERGIESAAVIDDLVTGAERGLMNIQSGRFFGWVMGGILPASLGADWLVSTWDQNAGLREEMPAVSALEEVASSWVLDLLGLPDTADVGFVTGGTMANFTGLAAAPFAVLERVGCDVHRDGLTGAPGTRAGRGRATRHHRPGPALPGLRCSPSSAC